MRFPVREVTSANSVLRSFLMDRVWRYCWAILLALPITAQTSGGPDLPIRLKTTVSSATSKPGDRVEAVVISGEYLGASIRGVVEAATGSTGPDTRASLRLHFTDLEIGRWKMAVDGRVSGVDNARETVDERGFIHGVLASETITGRLDGQIDQVGGKYSGLADILGAIKTSLFNPASTEIEFAPGVEMRLHLAASLPPRAPRRPQTISGSRSLAALQLLVAHEPFQAMSERPARPSDVTNLLLVGGEKTLRDAFAAAGWSVSSGLNPRAAFETFRALAEDRAFAEAPVSVLLLDGKPPGLVFEKTTDTFACRHHARVWRTPAILHGETIWVAAATHDTGISFSEADRTFLHRIDSQIDSEREKVADDLFFAGFVESEALLPRPQVPHAGRNATGDNIETDGKIVVLMLKAPRR